MFIDKQGRLFGRVNVVDATIILAIVIGLGLFGARRFGAIKLSVPNEKEVTIKFDSDPVGTQVIKSIDKGGQLYMMVGTEIVPLGAITEISENAAGVRIEDPVNGRVVYTKDPISRQMHLTIKAKGSLGKGVLTIGGQNVLVGDKFQLKTERAAFYGTAVDIKIED